MCLQCNTKDFMLLKYFKGKGLWKEGGSLQKELGWFASHVLNFDSQKSWTWNSHINGRAKIISILINAMSDWIKITTVTGSKLRYMGRCGASEHPGYKCYICLIYFLCIFSHRFFPFWRNAWGQCSRIYFWSADRYPCCILSDQGNFSSCELLWFHAWLSKHAKCNNKSIFWHHTAKTNVLFWHVNMCHLIVPENDPSTCMPKA